MDYQAHRHGVAEVEVDGKKTLVVLTSLLLGVGLAQGAAPSPAPTPAVPSLPPSAPVKPAEQGKAVRPPAANYVAVGNMYYNRGQFDLAYAAFRAASELDPKNMDALLGLGRSQAKVRLFEAAVGTLSRLVKLDPKNISAYIGLSQAYQQQYIAAPDRQQLRGNLTMALETLQQAEVLASAQAQADRVLSLSKVFNERGSVYRLQGEAAKAIEAFKTASSLNPENSLLFFNLGDMYANTGNLAAALASLQQAVILDPKDAYNRAYYAKLLAISGNAAAAKPEAAQAARLAPNNAYVVGQYGVVSYLLKEPLSARTQLNQALKLEPLRYPEFYYYLGRLDLDNNDLKAARENLTKAVALGSTMPEYIYYLGLAFERGQQGQAPDKTKARDNYERALKLAPNYRPAQEGLNRVR